MSANVWNGPSGSFMLDMGIKHYEVSLSQMLHDILGHEHIQRHPLLISHYTNLWTYYRTWPSYWFWHYNYQISGGFHRTLQRVRLANEGRLLLPTPGLVPFGTCICSNVETKLLLSFSCFRTLHFEHPSVLLFCFKRRQFCLAGCKDYQDTG